VSEKRSRKRSAALVVATVLVTSAVFAPLAAAVPSSHSPFRHLQRFAEVLARIEADYVEPVDLERMMQGAIRGMVQSLDPHSSYFTPEEYRSFHQASEGRFAGIGVVIGIDDGWLVVLSVFEGGPAARAGVRAGDRFMTIEGRPVRDIPVDDAVELMRGEPGTEVRIQLRREGADEGIALTLERAMVEVPAVEGRLLADRVLYVRLRTFQESTSSELDRVLDLAVAEAESHGGLRGIVLDLRNNGGGLLRQSIEVADEFLRSGVIVSTRGRGDRVLAEASSHARGTRPDWPMVVLVNGYTASAAEIVAGALRDHRRASVIGTRTFGKGSVQNVIELPDGSAMKITIARYFTPNGTSIQAHGIVPDMLVEQVDADAVRAEARPGASVSEATLEGHLEGEGAAEEEPGGEPLLRGGLRIEAEERDADAASAFPNDYQAHVAHQTLRAIAAQVRRN
jgi:carboxyl-terminal processing protease